MISESTPWKQELSRHLDAVRKWSARLHTRRGYFTVERAVFLSSFIVRRLIENRKVTDRIRNKSIRCQSYRPFHPLSNRVSRFAGVYDIGKEYDLAKPEKVTLSLFDLSSEVMHSYVFEPAVDDENNFIAFYVNSYRNQDDRLLRIDLDTYLQAADSVALDNVVEAHIWKDPKTGRIHADLR